MTGLAQRALMKVLGNRRYGQKAFGRNISCRKLTTLTDGRQPHQTQDRPHASRRKRGAPRRSRRSTGQRRAEVIEPHTVADALGVMIRR
jgi:hypothetical protein